MAVCTMFLSEAACISAGHIGACIRSINYYWLAATYWLGVWSKVAAGLTPGWLAQKWLVSTQELGCVARVHLLLLLGG